jgi:hypothetical protein
MTLDATLMTLDEILAREAIRYRLALYNNTGDRGAVDETVACFVEDSILQLGKASYCGRQSILAYFKMIMSSAYLSGVNTGPARHHITTSRIELIGETQAQAWTNYLLIRDDVIVQTGIYIDRYDSLPPAG